MSDTDEQQQEQDTPSGPPGASEDELDEINEERERRLAPENRPPNTEVDNTGDNAPDLSRVDPAAGDDEGKDDGKDDSGDDEGGREESGPPGASEDELDEINEERERRLAPENRPPNTEVDNTGDNAPDLSRVDPQADG